MKSKTCKNCDRPAFSKGLCQIHMPKNKIQSIQKPIKQSRTKTAQKKKETSEIRSEYFEYHLPRCTHSQESFKPINNPTRSNICHIIPKARHESVQAHLDNCIYLTEDEHSRFDHLLFNLEFDKLEKEFKNSWNNTCLLSKNLLNLCQENTVLTRAFKKYLNGRFES